MTTPPEVHVPLVLGRVQADVTHATLHDVDALLALRPADELADRSVEDSSGTTFRFGVGVGVGVGVVLEVGRRRGRCSGAK